MTDQQPVVQDDVTPNTQKISFGQMNFSQKLAFVGKLMIYIVTGAFAYPNLFGD